MGLLGDEINMKRKVFTVILIFASFNCFSQLKYFPILIGKTEAEVTTYLDSLNKLIYNPYYKIERGISEYGDLTLKCEYALADEEYYKCITVIAIFMRTKSSGEICSQQIISGMDKNAQANISYIKDNFKFVSTNTWEKKFRDDMDFMLRAYFELIKGGNHYFYKITYQLQ